MHSGLINSISTKKTPTIFGGETMVNEVTWEELTQAQIQEARNRQAHNQTSIERRKFEIEQLQKDEVYLAEYVLTLERALELSKKGFNVIPIGDKSIDFEILRKQPTWDNILTISKANKGLLVVVDAATILVKANVFGDREQARNTLYTTLANHKQNVQKIRAGVYSVNEVMPKEINNKKNDKPEIKRKHTTPGLLAAVKKLKTESPGMTRHDVLDSLTKSGFDFQDKRPSSSVNMAWLRLGYTKQESETKNGNTQITEQPDLFAVATT